MIVIAVGCLIAALIMDGPASTYYSYGAIFWFGAIVVKEMEKS